MIKKKLESKGLKPKWVAKQINLNYNSLRVYLNNESIMPEDVRNKILKLIA